MTGHERPQQEEDRLPMRTISIVLGVVILVTLGNVLYSWLVLDEREGALSPRPDAPRQESVSRPSGVDQTLFDDGPPFSARFLDEQRRRLGAYEWVDRERRLVRVPIERAMELVVKERR